MAATKARATKAKAAAAAKATSTKPSKSTAKVESTNEDTSTPVAAGSTEESRDGPTKRLLDEACETSSAPGSRLPAGESPGAINKAWRVWLLLGGRGSGKTRAGAEWVRSLARDDETSPRATAGSPQGSRGAQSKNQPARIALVGKTLADVRNVMIEGQSGLLAIHPAHERPAFEPSKRRLTWPNGAIAELFSADEAEALRGPQFTAAWCDELAKWRGAERAWDMLQFALRLGEAPRVCVTTTPRNTKLLKQIIADETTVTVNLATADNATNLAPSFLAEMTRRYAGSAIGRQELLGEIVEDASDGLWRRHWIEEARVEAAPEMQRVVVALDPPVPDATTYWDDGANWEHGHWVNGRLGGVALNEVVAAILTEQGFTEFDASGLTGTVSGYVIDRTMAARDAIQPLELAYFFDSIESSGKIVFRHRGRADAAMALTADDLVEENPGDALYELTRAQETDLPASAKVRYISGLADYPQAVVEARRLTGASGRVAEADLPIVLDDGLAGSIVESWLYETWATRESASFKLPPSTLALEPGDIVSATIAGRSRRFRLTDVSEHGVRDIQALSIDPSVYDQIDVPARTATPPPLVQIGSPAVALMDLPQWNTSYDASSGYAATMQKPWPGSVALFVSPQDTGYQLKAIASASATLGLTLDDIPPGPEGRIDRRASFRVRLTNGTLASADLVSVFAGANLAALRDAGGDWEIIQFQNAELVDAQTYRLSGLLRGQFGTEGAMESALADGAQFVLLDGAVARIPLQESERKLTLNWRYGPGNRNIGDESYVTVPFAYQGLGLRPLSPVHVKGTRTSGDILLSWIRRTRTGGDNWELPEVPLGEESETYEIDILDGETVKRTLMASEPSTIYSSIDQVTDFGSVQPSVSVMVYQTNNLFGRGSPRCAVV